MKLALVFLVAGAALAAGQNYYLHFAGGSRGEFQDLHASEVDARAPQGVYRPPQGVVPPPLLADAAFRSYPYGRYAGYDAGYDAAYFNNINNNNNNNNNNLGESEPRLFGANVLNLLGITTQTVYRYTATVTSASVTTVTDLCVSLAAGVATPAPACNGAAAGGRRGAGLRSDAGIAPSPPSIDRCNNNNNNNNNNSNNNESSIRKLIVFCLFLFVFLVWNQRPWPPPANAAGHAGWNWRRRRTRTSSRTTTTTTTPASRRRGNAWRNVNCSAGSTCGPSSRRRWSPASV